MTVIRLDRYLNLGSSKTARNMQRSAHRHERAKDLAATTKKDLKSIYNWSNGEEHYVEYDAATDQVTAITRKVEKVVWRAEPESTMEEVLEAQKMMKDLADER